MSKVSLPLLASYPPFHKYASLFIGIELVLVLHSVFLNLKLTNPKFEQKLKLHLYLNLWTLLTLPSTPAILLLSVAVVSCMWVYHALQVGQSPTMGGKERAAWALILMVVVWDCIVYPELLALLPLYCLDPRRYLKPQRLYARIDVQKFVTHGTIVKMKIFITLLEREDFIQTDFCKKQSQELQARDKTIHQQNTFRHGTRLYRKGKYIRLQKRHTGTKARTLGSEAAYKFKLDASGPRKIRTWN